MVDFDSPNSEFYNKNNIAESMNEFYDMRDSINEPNFQPSGVDNEQHQFLSMTNNDDKSPYFGNVRIESDKVRFISPIQKPDNNIQEASPKINRSILNELLPTNIGSSQIFEGDGESRIFSALNDKLAGWIFKASLLIWTVISIYLIVTTKTVSVPGLAQITGWFGALIVLGLGLSALWAKLLAEQTETVVYGLMLMVPGGFLVLGLHSLRHFYLLTGAVFVMISALVSAAVYFNRENMKNTVEIVRNSAIFLQANPQVYAFTLKVIAVYVVFLYVWLKAFLALSSGPFSFSFFLTIASLFMLIWVSSVLGVAQKFLIAAWVRNWMDAIEDASGIEEAAKAKLKDEEVFGTICLAAAILSVAKLIRITAKGTQLMIKSMNSFVPFSGFASWLMTMFSMAEALMQRFTDFTIYYLAVSGEKKGFIECSRALVRAIDGHVNLAVTTDATAQILLTFSTVLISFASTSIIVFFARGSLTWTSSALIGLLAVSITGFISTIYTASIDACFLCYVLDLKRADKAGRIDSNIQSAFESKLTPSSVSV